ncbi:MAG: hydantoinase B/oxoprolinase family protein [Chloroflexi bacterium]|nr:hydantoinase B/oxoprolinase family protein [Chloroflexota bacterium]
MLESHVAGTKVDPVLVSVLQRRLKSIAGEISQALLRASRSPLQNQARDMGSGLMDARGGMLEQDEFRALFCFAIPRGCQHVVRFYGDDVAPGDVILHNDVFAGGQQLSDTGIYIPIFDGEQLVAWAATKGHQLDLGGPVPSSCNPLATEYYQEGLRIPPVKIYEKNVFKRDVWNLIFSNMRLREIIEPDMRAQIGACMLGQRRVQALVARYGHAAFFELVEAIYDSAERMMRKEIQAIPDGTYTGETHITFDGIHEDRTYTIRVTVTVDGDEMLLDYTGTSPQAEAYTNAPLSSSISAALNVVFMLVSPQVPHNEGSLRPVHFNIPEGCMLNPRPPAATFYGNFTSAPHADAIFRAFAPALPQRVTAGWAKCHAWRITGWDPRRGRRYGDILFVAFKGGAGASDGLDGFSNAAPIYSVSTLTQDYELFELQDPHFLIHHEYEVDTGGPGRWRGGLGNTTSWRFDGRDGVAIVQGEDEGGYGVFGGRDGVPNRSRLIYPDGTTHATRCKEIIKDPLPPGTIVEQHSGGGGGFGDPLERAPEAVLEDVLDEFVSVEAAHRDYGVVIDPAALEIDYAATEALRESRRVGGAGNGL